MLTKIPLLTKSYSGSPESFNQTLTYELLCSSLHCPILARILLSWLSENPQSFTSDHSLHWIGFLILHHLPGDNPGLSSANILLDWFSQNPPFPLIFPPCHVLSTDHHPSSWLEILTCSSFRVEFNLSTELQNPISVVPTPLTMPAPPVR